MKKLLAIILAAAMLLCAFSGCSNTESTPSESEASSGSLADVDVVSEPEATKLDEIIEAGVLKVGTDPAWAPFEYIGADGEITGVDYEIAKNIADGLGVELEMVNIAFDSLIPSMESGEIDMILAAMTITEERAESVDFSNSYTVSQQYIIVLEDSTVEYIDDLAGCAIGVHLGTTGDFLVSDEIDAGVLAGTNATVSQYKYLTDACLSIQSGDLDAVVCDILLAKNLCSINEGLKCFELFWADGTATNEPYGIAMPKGETALVEKVNEIIDPLIADGTIDGYILDHSEKAAELN